MGVDIGGSGLTRFNLGDDLITRMHYGNNLLYVSNLLPISNFITSSVSGIAGSNVTVTFTSTVVDDDLTGGTYTWTGGSSGTQTFTHPTTTYSSVGSSQTRSIQCTFTDAGGLSLVSNIINQVWALPLLSRNFSAGPPLSFDGGGRAGVGAPSVPASEVGFGNAIARVDCPGFFDITFFEGTGYVNFSGSDLTTDYSAPSGANFSISRFAGTAGSGSVGWSIGSNATHLSGSGSTSF